MAPAVLLVIVIVGVSGTGFGASTTPTAQVLGTLSMTDPVTLSAEPPVCTKALAPLDTNGCTGVSFTPGAAKLLSLGSLSGSDVQAGALQWRVTTTSPTGYRVRMSNAGPAPLMQGAAGSIADMSSTAAVPAASVQNASHFGVALGDAAAAEGSVAFTGSPWVTASGQQGELFMGVPPSGMIVAERNSAQASDPFTATFAVAATTTQQPAAGTYSGLVRLVASII